MGFLNLKVLTRRRLAWLLFSLFVLVSLGLMVLDFTGWQGLRQNHAETHADHPNPALRTRHYQLSSETLFMTLQAVLNGLPRWKMLEGDLRTGRIIAQRETRLFRFVDDISISIEKVDQNHVILNIRSASRVGKGDFGQNARNIEELLEALDAKMPSKIDLSLDAAGHFEGLSTKLRTHIEHLALEIGPRHFLRKAAYQKAADYIDAAFQKAGYSPKREDFQIDEAPFLSKLRTTQAERHSITEQSYENIVAIKKGVSDEMIVVGAHYDTVPGTPGADDNASGVAVLLELARLLQSLKLSRTILFAAFANEEAPFFRTAAMGSAQFLKLKDRREKIMAMFSLEMLGYYSDAPDSQSYPPLLGFFYPDRANFIALVGNLSSRKLVKKAAESFREIGSIPLESLAAPRMVPGVDLSDQLNFWKAGIPAVMVTDTAYNRNPHYHGPGDLPETLDYEKMSEVTQALFRFLLQLGQVTGVKAE